MRFSVVVFLAAGASMPGQVKFRPEDIAVNIDGKPFTVFHYGTEVSKPYLAPLRSASGKIVTRHFPNEEVAGESQGRARTRGDARQGGDDRLRHGGNGLDSGVVVLPHGVQGGIARFQQSGVLAQVLARAERLASAGEHHRTDRIVGAAVPQRLQQGDLGLSGQRVPGLGPVDGDGRHGAVV